MWQKCPVCDGTGNSPNFNVVCSVCNGMKIISELTGRPPGLVPPSPHTYTGTDFRDAPMESQDEYFGKNK